MNGLDLFSGIGGIELAVSPWVRTVAYCESDKYAQSVLLSRMRSGDIDRAPIWDDIATLGANMLPKIHIIFGGFPCQDISTAGRGEGLEGKRSGLFFEICRLVSELRPRFVFLENVPAISVRGLDRVLLEFTSLGYDTRWTTISAKSLGACHIRKRWFLLAHANSEPMRIEYKSELNKQKIGTESTSEQRNATDTKSKGLESSRWEQKISRPVNFGGWTSEPSLRGRDHGVPNRVDKLRCLGNSVVPMQAREAFKKLMGLL